MEVDGGGSCIQFRNLFHLSEDNGKGQFQGWEKAVTTKALRFLCFQPPSKMGKNNTDGWGSKKFLNVDFELTMVLIFNE